MKKIRSIALFGSMLALGTLFGIENRADPNLYPIGFPLIEREGYSVVYDGRSKIPYWTIEHLTKENVSGRMASGRFIKDNDIYPLHQSTNADYAHSGFDRGHMVPDADRDNTAALRDETYLYSNACPQIHDFNDGIWGDLEEFVRNLVMNNSYDSVDVITGPLFLPYQGEDGKRYVTYQVIGNNDVAVPTHFYKVIYGNKGTNTHQWGYILPTTAARNDSIDNYEATIEKIEKLSGLEFKKNNHH